MFRNYACVVFDNNGDNVRTALMFMESYDAKSSAEQAARKITCLREDLPALPPRVKRECHHVDPSTPYTNTPLR